MDRVVKGKLKLNPAAKAEVSRQVKAMKRGAGEERKREEQPMPLEPYEIEQDILPGTGKVFISGTTVHGINTAFQSELASGGFLSIRVGDAIEKRKVILVLSDKSACLNEPFSEEYSGEFSRQDPPIKVDPRKELEEKLEKRRKLAETTHTYDVRVKRGPWTYKTDNVVSDKEMSREQLLNVRAQRVRDKHCWM